MPNLTTRRAACALALAATLSLGGCATSGTAPTKVTVGTKIAEGQSALPSDIRQILMAGGLDLADPGADTGAKPTLVAAGKADPMGAALAAVAPRRSEAPVRVAALEPRREARREPPARGPSQTQRERGGGASSGRSAKAPEAIVVAVAAPAPVARPADAPQLVAYAPPSLATPEPAAGRGPEVVGATRIEAPAPKPVAVAAVAEPAPAPLKVVAPPPAELSGSAVAAKGGRVRRF